MSETFPYQANGERAYRNNPAIQLFGNRLFTDQTPVEFLVEFLLLTTSPKRIEGNGSFDDPLPSEDILQDWSNSKLEYAPKSRLNLKLFSFLGSSRLESRHKTHREHRFDLLNILKSKTALTGIGNKDDVVRTLENLFLGFQGAGSGRTWCAQNFLPVCEGFLAGERIWKETRARTTQPKEWEDLLNNSSYFFETGQRVILARGGEVLYLQICNALRQDKEIIRQWAEESGVMLDSSNNNNEQDPAWLHAELMRELGSLMHKCPKAITELAEFIDSGIEPETAEKTDFRSDSPRYVSAGWCPVESWQEGYLFAVELLRLCKSNLDVIDRIYLLETACAMQVLRSLAFQSARYTPTNHFAAWPGYRLAVSAPEENRPIVKRVSQQTVKMIEKQIFQAIRNEDRGIALPDNEKERNKVLKEADNRYAGKFFIKLAKRLGLVIPRRGAGARFVLNEQLLRLLVLTVVPKGGRITYDRFKEIVERRFGLVFDADGIGQAGEWLADGNRVYLPNDTDNWLQEMLEAAGFLLRLSDSCAMVVEDPAAACP